MILQIFKCFYTGEQLVFDGTTSSSTSFAASSSSTSFAPTSSHGTNQVAPNDSNSMHFNSSPSSDRHTAKQEHQHEYENERTQTPSSARSAKQNDYTIRVNRDLSTESSPPSPPPLPPQCCSSPHFCSPWGQHILFTVYQSYVGYVHYHNVPCFIS